MWSNTGNWGLPTLPDLSSIGEQLGDAFNKAKSEVEKIHIDPTQLLDSLEAVKDAITAPVGAPVGTLPGKHCLPTYDR